jgi:hypothetical protein
MDKKSRWVILTKEEFLEMVWMVDRNMGRNRSGN